MMRTGTAVKARETKPTRTDAHWIPMAWYCMRKDERISFVSAREKKERRAHKTSGEPGEAGARDTAKERLGSVGGRGVALVDVGELLGEQKSEWSI
jgi:hypothetical protein